MVGDAAQRPEAGAPLRRPGVGVAVPQRRDLLAQDASQFPGSRPDIEYALSLFEPDVRDEVDEVIPATATRKRDNRNLQHKGHPKGALAQND